MNGFYVVAGDYEVPEVYDGRDIPAAADGVFRLKVGIEDANDPAAAEANAVWITLPIPREEADSIVKDSFGVESVEALTSSPVFLRSLRRISKKWSTLMR